MSSISHDEACQYVAAWMTELRWCQLATTEIAGAYYDVPRVAGRGGGQLDVLGVSRPGRPCRVVVAEIKVSRADLRADLRRRKMLRYESQATHCYLAVTDPVWLPASTSTSRTEVFHAWKATLEDMGLPREWGILTVRSDGYVRVARGAQALAPPRGLNVTEDRHAAVIERIARSCSYRYRGLMMDKHRRARYPDLA